MMKYKYLLILLTSFLLVGCNKQETSSSTASLNLIETEKVSEIILEIETEEVGLVEEQTELVEETQEEGTTGINAKEKEIEVFNLVNEEREKNGLVSLEWDSRLYDTAKIRAEEASRYWSHTRPDGTHWTVLAEELDGENLAKGYYSAEEAFYAWMESEEHRENILRSEFTRIAVYFYETENGWFWCQHFGY